MEAAVKRREAAAAQGYDPDSSIIEKVRDRLDLAGELVMRGYKASSKNGRFLYPESETGVPGVYLLTGRDGVQRAYSHHAGDPAV
jgi:hypothetical protein